jgi:hypothetical protein
MDLVLKGTGTGAARTQRPMKPSIGQRVKRAWQQYDSELLPGQDMESPSLKFAFLLIAFTIFPRSIAFVMVWSQWALSFQCSRLAKRRMAVKFLISMVGAPRKLQSSNASLEKYAAYRQMICI